MSSTTKIKRSAYLGVSLIQLKHLPVLPEAAGLRSSGCSPSPSLPVRIFVIKRSHGVTNISPKQAFTFHLSPFTEVNVERSIELHHMVLFSLIPNIMDIRKMTQNSHYINCLPRRNPDCELLLLRCSHSL